MLSFQLLELNVTVTIISTAACYCLLNSLQVLFHSYKKMSSDIVRPFNSYNLPSPQLTTSLHNTVTQCHLQDTHQANFFNPLDILHVTSAPKLTLAPLVKFLLLFMVHLSPMKIFMTISSYLKADSPKPLILLTGDISKARCT